MPRKTKLFLILIFLVCAISTSFVFHKLNQDKVYFGAGAELMRQGQYAEASLLFEQALKCHSKNPLFLQNYGWALLESGRVSEAQQVFRNVMNLRPNLTEVQRGLSETYALTGYPDLAIFFLQQRLTKEPHDWKTQLSLARAFLHKKQFDEAKSLLEQVLEKHPTQLQAKKTWDQLQTEAQAQEAPQ